MLRRRSSKRSRRSVSWVITETVDPPQGHRQRACRQAVGGRPMNGVSDRSSAAQYDPGMRQRPQRLARLPQQYFVGLLGRVTAAAAAGGGAPLVDLGRGNPETGPPPHVVEALREAGSRSRRSTATRRSAACRARRKRSPPATGTSTASRSIPRPRSPWIPGTKTAIVELALSLCERGRHPAAARPLLPGLSLWPRARGRAEVETVPLDGADHSWAPDLEQRAGGGGALPQLSVESRAPSVRPTASSRTRSPGRAGRAAPSSTTPRTSTSCSTAASRRASSRRPARRTSASRCGRCRRRTGWRAGASASSSATPRSSSAINLLNDHSRVGIFAPLQSAAIAALAGPQDSVAERRRRLRAPARHDSRPRCPSAPVCEGTFYVWLQAAGRAHGRAAPRRAPRRRSRPARASGRAAPGWVRISLAVDDEQIELGAERLQRAFAAVAGAAH